MNYDVELPDLGNDGGDHATVSEWHVEEGEYVKEGEILVEVLSESGGTEIPAPRSGTLLEIIVAEDEVARVGESLAVIECDEEDQEEDINEDDEVAKIEPDADEE